MNPIPSVASVAYGQNVEQPQTAAFLAFTSQASNFIIVLSGLLRSRTVAPGNALCAKLQSNLEQSFHLMYSDTSSIPRSKISTFEWCSHNSNGIDDALLFLCLFQKIYIRRMRKDAFKFIVSKCTVEAVSQSKMYHSIIIVCDGYYTSGLASCFQSAIMASDAKSKFGCVQPQK